MRRPQMRPDDIRAYQQRWALVAEVERQEIARMTPEEKFRDLSQLYQFARSLDGSTHTDEEVEQVRHRWVLLAERLGV